MTTIDEAWELFGRDTTPRVYRVPRLRTLRPVLWIGLQWDTTQRLSSDFHPQPATLSALETGVTLRWIARETWPSAVGYTVSLHANSPPVMQRAIDRVQCFSGDTLDVTIRLEGVTRVFEGNGWHHLRA